MMRVVCALLKSGDKIFLARRSAGMKHSGKWEFPGGKIQSGEDEIQAVKREIFEELNVDIEVMQLLPAVHWPPENPVFTLLPILSVISRGIIELREHEQGKWCSSTELHDMDILPADLHILERSKSEIWL